MPGIDAIGGSHGAAVRIVSEHNERWKDGKGNTCIKCRRNKQSVVTLLSH